MYLPQASEHPRRNGTVRGVSIQMTAHLRCYQTAFQPQLELWERDRDPGASCSRSAARSGLGVQEDSCMGKRDLDMMYNFFGFGPLTAAHRIFFCPSVDDWPRCAKSNWKLCNQWFFFSFVFFPLPLGNSLGCLTSWLHHWGHLAGPQASTALVTDQGY